MTTQIIQQSKSNSERKAVASLVLGIISVGSSLLLYGITLGILILGIRTIEGTPAMCMYLLGKGLLFSGLLTTIPGLTLGIMGLKSTKRNFAIAGIIFCIIGLLVSLYHFLS